MRAYRVAFVLALVMRFGLPLLVLAAVLASCGGTSRPPNPLLTTTAAAVETTQARPGGTPRTIRVPQDAATVQGALDSTQPGDLVLIAPGTYREAVTIRTPGIVVRGLDRNAVVFDGEDQKENGILVAADGVAVENLTIRRYAVNGLLFTKAYDDADPTQHTVLDGYRASYVTASNNGLYGIYGIYAFFARGGQIDHAYVSGHPDSGIDIGQCKPCDAVVTDSVTEDIPSFFECQPMDRFSTSATCGRHTASPSGAVDEQSGEVRRRSPTDSSWSVRESFLACDCTCSGSAPLQARPPPVMAFNDGFAPPERFCPLLAMSWDFLPIEYRRIWP